MRYLAVGVAAILLTGCVSPVQADLTDTAETVTRAENSTAAEEPAETSDPAERVPPEPDAEADAVFAAWQAERDALFSGAREPSLDWHEVVLKYWKTSAEASDPFFKEIYRRVAFEQYGRYGAPFTPELAGDLAKALGFELNAVQARGFQQRLFYKLMDLDADNSAFLKRELAARGGQWWTITEVGSDASMQIWLMTQHADQDRDFQRHALALMEPLAEDGEVSGSNYAYLWDRVAVAEKRPQRYGTQGGCTSADNWDAAEIEAPAEDIDMRRSAVGISMTFAAYDELMDGVCRDGY